MTILSKDYDLTNESCPICGQILKDKDPNIHNMAVGRICDFECLKLYWERIRLGTI